MRHGDNIVIVATSLTVREVAALDDYCKRYKIKRAQVIRAVLRGGISPIESAAKPRLVRQERGYDFAGPT